MTRNVSRTAMSLVGVGAMTAAVGDRPGEKSSSGEKKGMSGIDGSK